MDKITPHVELLKYRGKNGGFAHHFSTLWLARLVGVDGGTRTLDQSTWHGDTDEARARRSAMSYAAWLGVPYIERHDNRPATEGGSPPTFGTYDMKAVAQFSRIEQLVRPADGSTLPYEEGWRVLRSIRPEGPNPEIEWERKIPYGDPSGAVTITLPPLRTMVFPRDPADRAPHPILDALAVACQPWSLASIGHALRKHAGLAIPEKGEAEYAAALYWLVMIALKHGPDWRFKLSEELDILTAHIAAEKPCPACDGTKIRKTGDGVGKHCEECSPLSPEAKTHG